MLAIMLLKASEPARGVVVGRDVVVVSEGVPVVEAGFKDGGRVPSPSLKSIKRLQYIKKIVQVE